MLTITPLLVTPKNKFVVVPDIEPDAEPENEPVLISAHVASSLWMPVPLVDPDIEVPLCVSVMEIDPPSLAVHPGPAGTEALHVPTHVPVSVGVTLCNCAPT